MASTDQVKLKQLILIVKLLKAVTLRAPLVQLSFQEKKPILMNKDKTSNKGSRRWVIFNKIKFNLCLKNSTSKWLKSLVLTNKTHNHIVTLTYNPITTTFLGCKLINSVNNLAAVLRLEQVVLIRLNGRKTNSSFATSTVRTMLPFAVFIMNLFVKSVVISRTTETIIIRSCF